MHSPGMPDLIKMNRSWTGCMTAILPLWREMHLLLKHGLVSKVSANASALDETPGPDVWLVQILVFMSICFRCGAARLERCGI